MIRHSLRRNSHTAIRRARRSGTHSISTWTAGAAAAVLALASSCASLDEELEQARRRPIVGDGGRTVGVSGHYAYREDEDQEREAFALRATLDEYLTDNHVLGAYGLGQYTNEEFDDDGREQLWAGFHYHYHFHINRRTSIYAGPSVGWTWYDNEGANSDSFTWGVSGGIRHWLTERAAITIEPAYLRSHFDDDAGDVAEEFLILWGFAFSL